MVSHVFSNWKFHEDFTYIGRPRYRFFSGGGGKNVDMPSDCQNIGGAQAYPSH